MILFLIWLSFAGDPPASSPWMASDYWNPVWQTPRNPDGTRDPAWLFKARSRGLNLSAPEIFTDGKATPDIKWKSTADLSIRMIDHWDNFDGSVERGYSGRSIFFEDGKFRQDWKLIEEYAQLLASIRINAISINNVNVREGARWFVTNQHGDLNYIKIISDIFAKYGISTFISINFAAPKVVGNLTTFDPLNASVRAFWAQCAKEIYTIIPKFGGFLVKADAEGEPGPFTYNRTHADGANMLGNILQQYNGLVIWRCFVYNSKQDWRDRTTDRPKAAYETFMPYDGTFAKNVLLQIKNGPLDFQIKEPVSSLFGRLRKTNQMLELQITQEYLGQQQHIVYLAPIWSEVYNWRTYAQGLSSDKVGAVIRETSLSGYSGVAGVSNIGLDLNWAGNKLAQANLYAYGRLAWDNSLTPEQIAEEYVELAFSNISARSKEVIKNILVTSRETHRQYTVPFGLSCLCRPSHHYGPDIDGYEYDRWGGYHFADRFGVGVDRTVETGTGYTAQYLEPVAKLYDNLSTCPDDDMLFFHHVNYSHKIHNGKTMIQHIYDTHFEGARKVQEYADLWKTLEGDVGQADYQNVNNRLKEQLSSATQWRDIVNTYFWRMSGIDDEHKGEPDRVIYR